MLIGELVRVDGAARPYAGLSVVCTRAGVHLVALDVLASSIVARQVLNVQGGRLALRSDICDRRGPLLIHHLHALPLPALDALLVVGARSSGHLSVADVRRRVRNHLKMLVLADGVQPLSVVVVILATRLLAPFESTAR